MRCIVLGRLPWGLEIVLTTLQFAYIAQCQLTRFDAREATIETVQHDLFSGLTTCRDVVSAFLARIEALNNKINAIMTINPECLSDADRLDGALAAGNTTDNMFTTGGNLALAVSQPSIDAPVVTALRRAGAVVLGKASLHELALEGLSVSSLGGQTINPYDFTRTPGGSSGGSGAAVAASFSVFATGTDTVNSLRSPASANSLFSVRPTRGLITRTGIVPISYTQDAIGPITRTAKDVAIALTVMASTGYDPNDNTTALVPASVRGIDYAASLTTGTLGGLRLGLINGFFNRIGSNETDPVNTAMDLLIVRLQLAGAIIVPVNDILYNATALSNAYDVQQFEYREGMNNYLSQSSLLGTHPATLNELYNSSNFLVIPAQYSYVNNALVSSSSNATYAAVKQGIQDLKLTLRQTLSSNNLDALIYPEQTNLVMKIGSPSQSGRNGILAALTGLPVVTVPAGFSPPTRDTPVGVPIGMEILGAEWSEQKLLRIAYQIERLTNIRKMPQLAEEVIDKIQYSDVPIIVPNRGNIPAVYPVGVVK